MRILGIDPGVATVGFGVIEAQAGRQQMIPKAASREEANGTRSPAAPASTAAASSPVSPKYRYSRA